MTRAASIRQEFVEFIPDKLERNVLYISIQFATAAHTCCCGCGLEVVTPLSPRDWKLVFDGETVSLDPSIGNWSFPCRSHYWIKRNAVDWAARWSPSQVATARASEAVRRSPPAATEAGAASAPARAPKPTIRQRMRRWLWWKA